MWIERNRLLALVALVVATSVSTGCGGGGSDDVPDVAITTQQVEGAAPTAPARAASGTTRRQSRRARGRFLRRSALGSQ